MPNPSLYFHLRHLLLLLATTVFLAPLPALGAKRPKPELCPDARYVQRDAVVPGGGAVEVLVVGSTMSIMSGCPPTKAKRKATRKGTRVTAAWRACTGLKGRATFTGMIANGCGTLAGTFKAKKAKRTVKISAGKSTCGDGTHDPGAEGCDGGASCAAGRICDAATCTCVADPTPPGGTNSPPIARFTTPLAGQVGTALSFDAL